MKRAKIMLMTIAVLAVVGGALAFKSQTFGSTHYCWLQTTTQPSDGACTNFVQNKAARAVGTGENKVYYTAAELAGDCSSLACPNVGIPDQQ